jgi:hypothetical protein
VKFFLVKVLSNDLRIFQKYPGDREDPKLDGFFAVEADHRQRIFFQVD